MIEMMMNSNKFDETALCLGLGLPGGGGAGSHETTVAAAATTVVMKTTSGGKRGFSETVDLKLNLSGKDEIAADDVKDNMKMNGVSSAAAKEKNLMSADPVKPPAKAQVVGWPPVRSYRKNVLATQKSSTVDQDNTKEKIISAPAAASAAAISNGGLVKVSMDGAPYLRKVDLKLYKSYQDLSEALGKMFSSFTIGNYGPQGMIDFMNESKLMDLLNDSDYVPTYEDKDGDWMLVGDVPWEMFVESCKRLRIMKGKEAAGLAPRAMEKCKNRS